MKRFKKMSVILLLCMLVSMLAMPVSAKAAALNRKSITLNEGKSYKLKAKGIKGRNKKQGREFLLGSLSK